MSLGTSSSLSCVDLNSDGVKDCVLGAGLNEFDQTDSSVIAINGLDGSVLWATPGTDQVVGSPIFIKINDDEIPDVVIGGRGAQLYAINGSNGQELWKYKIQSNDFNALGYIRFNFYTPQPITDQDDDGIMDLLVTNGGNFNADPVSGDDRYPGVLLVVSGANGEVIAAATMPDKAETYMSPVILEEDGAEEFRIIYGSGGETFGGHLYEVGLSDLMRNDLSNSKVILARENHGFIAPPTLTDITGDGIKDIVVNWHGGEMIAIDRMNYSVIWKVFHKGSEIYASPTPGFANRDSVPDFFTQFTVGEWPNYSDGHQKVIDGTDGSILFESQLGCGSFSTALSFDSDQDGHTEFLFSINDFDCDAYYRGNTQYSLKLLDLDDKSVSDIIAPLSGKNIFSTPWLGDLNNDNTLDIVTCIQSNYNDELSYFGIHLYRLALNNVKAKGQVKIWNEYLGPNKNGNF